jgi:nicotinate phosphoribosyltransferase
VDASVDDEPNTRARRETQPRDAHPRGVDPLDAHTTSLLTDQYELTMLDAALRDGSAARPSVFEVFARRLPEGRRYGVLAGLDRLIDAIERFRFGDAELGHLDDHRIVSPATLAWLADYRFRGELVAYQEGEVYLPGSPVLTVAASFGEAVVLETLILSVLNHDSAIASAAARMVTAADGRTLFEFGARRTHEIAAVAAARAAYLVGFDGTSNLEAGRRYGVPTLGTSAHAYSLVHDDEVSAFRAQVAALGTGTTLLVDTYDTTTDIERAIAVAGPELGGIRIDSGDIVAETHRARRQLDALGATGTRIVLSGDLDERRITELRATPADAYGVGTSVVTGSGAPTANFVYKLVARATGPDTPLLPVAKGGGRKATLGGRKAAARRIEGGVAVAEVLHPWGTDAPAACRPLQVAVMAGGEVLHRPSLDEIRAHHATVRAELPPEALLVEAGTAFAPTEHRLPALAGDPDGSLARDTAATVGP